MKCPRLFAAIAGVFAFAFLATGCVGVANPEGWAPPVIDGDTAIILQERDLVSAIDLTTGQVRWSFPDDRRPREKDIDLRAIYAAPIPDGDRLYLADYDGDVFAINRQDGSLTWQNDDLEGNIVGTPVLHEGRLFVATTHGRLYAIAAEDGQFVAGFPRDGVHFERGIWASPVLAAGRLVVATMDGEIVAVNPNDGSIAWSNDRQTSAAVPDLAGLPADRIFVPSFDRNVYVLNGSDGAFIARHSAGDWVWTHPTVTDAGMVYGDFGGDLFLVDITSGQQRWHYPADARFKSSPQLFGNVLIAVDRDPIVHFVDIRTGQRLNSVPIEGAGTVRADVGRWGNKGVIVTTKGRVYIADPEFFSVVELTLGEPSP